MLEHEQKKMVSLIHVMAKELEDAGRMRGTVLAKNPDGNPFVHDLLERYGLRKFAPGDLADGLFDENPDVIREEMFRRQNRQEEMSMRETAAQYPTPTIAHPIIGHPAIAHSTIAQSATVHPEQKPEAGHVDDQSSEDLSLSHFLHDKSVSPPLTTEPFEVNQCMVSPESISPASLNMSFPTVPSNYEQQLQHFNQPSEPYGFDWDFALPAVYTSQRDVGLKKPIGQCVIANSFCSIPLKMNSLLQFVNASMTQSRSSIKGVCWEVNPGMLNRRRWLL